MLSQGAFKKVKALASHAQIKILSSDIYKPFKLCLDDTSEKKRARN